MEIFAALQGLGKDYEPLITSVEGSVDMLTNPTLEDLIPRLHSYVLVFNATTHPQTCLHISLSMLNASTTRLATITTEEEVRRTEGLEETKGEDPSPPEGEDFINNSPLQDLGPAPLCPLFPQMRDLPVRYAVCMLILR